MAGVASRIGLAGLAAVVALAAAGCTRTTFGPPIASPGELVRGSFGGFWWATGDAGPTSPIAVPDPATLRAAVERSQAAVRADLDDAFTLAIVGTFPTTQAATDAAADLRDVFRADEGWFADPAHADARSALLDLERDSPISDPAAAWLTVANLAPGARGLGWGGRAAGSDDPADAVWTVDRLVIVTGLEVEGTGSLASPPIHPIAHRWAAAGAEVRLEGDDGGSGGMTADVSCRPADDASARALRDEIGDALDVGRWYPIPPWVGRPTSDQAATRAEIGRYQALAMNAMNDPGTLDLIQRIATAGPAERAALMEALNLKIGEAVRAAAQGRVSAEIVDLLAAPPDGTKPDEYDAWERRISERIGAVELRPDAFYPTADASGPTAVVGAVRVRGGRLEIGGLALGRVSTGLPLLLAWLTEQGCGDARIGLTDSEP
jgi:hypothetical protein